MRQYNGVYFLSNNGIDRSQSVNKCASFFQVIISD